ncbi:DUF2630 family protein [Nitrospira japonica]|uniref:DUF2630 family protein n=1 Tax=Nitrospira japonica TaxID=1325564 RepID=UPI0009BB54C2|nr:DUF2630 family protein [Nitrospira japonica]
MDTKRPSTDQPVLAHIQDLVQEEHRLFEKGEHGTVAEKDRHRLTQVQVELDQCWDLLRQRRALRDAGQDPNQAQVRPARVVENYEQ